MRIRNWSVLSPNATSVSHPILPRLMEHHGRAGGKLRDEMVNDFKKAVFSKKVILAEHFVKQFTF